MKLNTRLGFIVLFFILSIGRAESPLPPPYYEYNISGYLENILTKNNANYTLQLFGLPNKKYNVEKWIQCKGMNKVNERPLYVTDSTG